MKVLMVAPGESTHSHRVLSWLLNNGVQVYFCDPINPLPGRGNNFFYIPYPRRGTRTIRRILGSKLGDEVAYRMAGPSLRRIYHMIEPDIVHVHQIDHRAYQCMRAGMKPLILTAWGSDINRHFMDHADHHFRSLIGETLKSADYTFVDAQNIIEKCMTLAGQIIPVELLTMGVNTQIFHSGYNHEVKILRRELVIPDDAEVLLSPRSLTHLYRQGFILQAFSSLIGRYQRSIFLVFKRNYKLAEAERIEAELLETAKKLGIEQYIRFIDKIPYEQMPIVYCLADLVLNFPVSDGFPVTFLEAAACGRPVITNRLPAYQDTFAEKYFYLVDSDNEAGLSEGLIKVLESDNEERKWRVEEAEKIVKKSFDETRTIQRLLEVYSTIKSMNK